MAIPIKRIEKDFRLKLLFVDGTPIVYIRNKEQYTLTLDKLFKRQLVFKIKKPIEGLKVNQKLDLSFDFYGQILTFSVEVTGIKSRHIITTHPEFLYRDLDRSYYRVHAPMNLHMQFTYSGDRYSLSFPKVNEYLHISEEQFAKSIKYNSFNELVDQISTWLKKHSSNRKLVIFKDGLKPDTIEERLLVETGKSFYLPSSLGSLLHEDPYPKKRLITEEMFKQYLESIWVHPMFVDDTCDQFIKEKYIDGVFSDLWVPILFQEYVIGYFRIWTSSELKPPFSFDVIDSLYQYSTVLSSSLKVNGYFESGKMKPSSFKGSIFDISASGLLFTYPHSALVSSLLPDSELSITFKMPRRTVIAKARIIHRFIDNIQGFFGCKFIEMQPEDQRYLFEYIYGRPITDEDTRFLAGRV